MGGEELHPTNCRVTGSIDDIDADAYPPRPGTQPIHLLSELHNSSCNPATAATLSVGLTRRMNSLFLFNC